MNLVKRVCRYCRGIEIAVVWIDNQISFSAVSASDQHRGAKRFASVGGLHKEQIACAGRLTIGHVQCLWTVGGKPLAVVGNDSRGRGVNLPSLGGIRSFPGTSLPWCGGSHISHPETLNIEINARREVR